MIRLILTLLATSFFFAVNGQDITWQAMESKPQHRPDPSYVYELDDNSFLSIQFSEPFYHKYYVTKYNSKTGKEIKHAAQKLKYSFGFYIDLKELFFVSNRGKKIFIQRLDSNTLSLSEPRQILTGLGWSKKISQNKDYCLFYKIKNVSRKKRKKMEAYVFDSKMNLLWHKDFFDLQAHQLNIDNLGNLFFATFVPSPKSELGQDMTMHYYSRKGETPKTLFTTITNNLVTPAFYWSPEPGIIKFWSPYYESKSFSNALISGYYYQDFDFNSGTTPNKKTYPIPESLLSISPRVKKITSKRLNKNNGIMKGFNSTQILTVDGHTIIVMEYNSDLNDIWQPRSSVILAPNKTTYHSSIFVCLAIDNSGEMLWHKTINKHQKSDSFTFLSYAFFYSSKNLYFLFNDRKENITNRKENKDIKAYKPKNTQKSKKNQVVTLITIDYNGHLSERILPNQEIRVAPNLSCRVDDHLSIIFGRKKKKRGAWQIGRISLE